MYAKYRILTDGGDPASPRGSPLDWYIRTFMVTLYHKSSIHTYPHVYAKYQILTDGGDPGDHHLTVHQCNSSCSTLGHTLHTKGSTWTHLVHSRCTPCTLKVYTLYTQGVHLVHSRCTPCTCKYSSLIISNTARIKNLIIIINHRNEILVTSGMIMQTVT